MAFLILTPSFSKIRKSSLLLQKAKKSERKKVARIIQCDNLTLPQYAPTKRRIIKPTAMIQTSKIAICLSLRLYAKFRAIYRAQNTKKTFPSMIYPPPLRSKQKTKR